MGSFLRACVYSTSLFLFFSTVNCQSDTGTPPQSLATKIAGSAGKDPTPSRRELLRQLYRSKTATVIYDRMDENLAQRQMNFLKDLRQKAQPRFDLELVPVAEVTPDLLREKNILFLGTSSLLKGKKASMPFQFASQSFTLANSQYSKDDQILCINIYPNPWNPARSMSIFYANEASALLDLLEQKLQLRGGNIFWQNWGYEVFENGERIRMGHFDDDTWQLGDGFQFDFSKQNNNAWQSDHFTLQPHNFQLEEKQAQVLLTQLESKRSECIRFLGDSIQLSSPITYKIYQSSEEKGLITRNSQQGHFDIQKQTIYEIKNELYAGRESSVLNEFLLLQQLGTPRTQGLAKGLAVYLTKNWQKKGYQWWSARLVRSENYLGLAELLDNEQLSDLSELVTAPLLASFTDYLIETYGREFYLAHYTTWQPDPGEISRLEKEWIQFITQQYPIISNSQRPMQEDFLKGFNFAHEGYSVYNGYGSSLAQKSLERISQLGGNAVAIIPYSYMRDPTAPTVLPIMQRAGTEDDPSVIRSAFDARQLKMKTLLKPQIWIRGSWPGAVKMDSDEQWEQWFDHYYRWILHYALLAEMYQFDHFCLGVEFVQATQSKPALWEDLLRKIRGVFSGPITYAANWGEEFENITLWEQLDYIGLNCYYPLGQEQELSQEELNDRFALILDKVEKIAQKYNKPVVFTEIGFRNVEQCWRNPHAEANGRTANQEHQRKCYQAVARGLEGRRWCRGILWWKWPSYMDYSQRNATSFTPCDKAATEVVRNMFNTDAY